MTKSYLIIGSTLSLLAVLIGAFGAHGLQSILVANGRVATFETAVQYHMFHALAFLFTGLLMQKNPHQLLSISCILFLVGILIFSGSLYLLSITNQAWLGMVTPVGGVFFIAGWTLLIYYLIRKY